MFNQDLSCSISLTMTLLKETQNSFLWLTESVTNFPEVLQIPSISCLPSSFILLISSGGVVTSEFCPCPSTILNSSSDSPDRVIATEEKSLWKLNITLACNRLLHFLSLPYPSFPKTRVLYIEAQATTLKDTLSNFKNSYLIKILIVKWNFSCARLSNTRSIIWGFFIS